MKNQPDKTNPADKIKNWVELYSDEMYSWALHKTSSKEEAEDLVQETFLATIRAFDKFQGKSNPKTWLYSILNNKINDHFRNKFRKPYISVSDDFFGSNGQWKEGELPSEWINESGNLHDDIEFQNTLSQCIKKLPGNWFSVIQLKYLDGSKNEMICQELQITTTNLWQMIHRAKLHLRKCLDVNWFKK